MSGKHLVETLKGLNYPGFETLDPQALDWMFENDAVAPMLEWFCSNVNQSNILQPKETEEYKKLCQSGEVVLRGRQLDEALSNLDLTKDDSVSEESLKTEIEQLENDLQHYKKQKDRLSKRRDLLSNQHTSLSHRQSKLTSVKAKAQHEYKTALEETHSTNAQMNDTLERLTECVTDLSSLYNRTPTETQDGPAKTTHSVLPSSMAKSLLPCQTGSPSMFLSQVPIQQYYSAEEAFTTQLTAYTKKQFFQGIAEMASCDEDSRFEILEVSDPDSLLVRGDTEEVNIQDCKDLARLQKLYVKSETDRMKALCEMKRLKGQLGGAKEVLESLKTGTFCTESLKNKERLEKIKCSLQSVQRDFVSLADQEVPQLIQECRQAKVLRVLTGDYNLKLSRQDYFTSNQDKVINQLILQRSRNEFVTMALEVELRGHREVHHILTALYNQLNDQFVQWQARMVVMSDKLLTPARHERVAIDSRDKSTARIFRMLDESEEGTDRQLFHTYASLVENAETLHQRHAGLHTKLQSTNSHGHDDIQILEKNVCTCEELIYAGSSTSRGLPPLTPRPIQDNIIQLQDMIKQLEQGILDVVKDLDQKKKLLKNDPLLARKRKLSTYFFTNPAKLHQTMEEISAKLQAESHMDKTQQR